MSAGSALPVTYVPAGSGWCGNCAVEDDAIRLLCVSALAGLNPSKANCSCSGNITSIEDDACDEVCNWGVIELDGLAVPLDPRVPDLGVPVSELDAPGSKANPPGVGLCAPRGLCRP